MNTVTVGARHQIVIPKSIRLQLPSLKPGAKVTIRSLDNHNLKITVPPTNWAKGAAGIMSAAWKQISPSNELEKLRDQWDK